MLKLCDLSLCTPLIFESCIGCKNFPGVWGKKVVLLIKNYRIVPLLPICGKLLEKLMLNSISTLLILKMFLQLMYEPWFLPNDSCVHQLFSIVHEIYNAFDVNPSFELKGVFLEISKAFDRLWHKGLLRKMHGYRLDFFKSKLF